MGLNSARAQLKMQLYTHSRKVLSASSDLAKYSLKLKVGLFDALNYTGVER